MLSTSAVPYRCELLQPASLFKTEISGLQGPRTHLSRVKTSGAMTVHAALPDDSYAVVLAVAGELEHRTVGQAVAVRPGCGLIQSPLQPVYVRTPEQFELVFLRLHRAQVVQELEKLLLRPIRIPPVFSPRFELRSSAGQSFRRLLSNLCLSLGSEAKEGNSGLGGYPRGKIPQNLPQAPLHANPTAQAWENDLVTLLLDSQRHNYSRLLVRDQKPGPWQLRSAEEYMAANAHLTLSLGDVCLAAGVSSRTLQHSFQSKRGCTPMQFLKRLRMQRAHADLSSPGETATVTEVATRWGFLHFGRFAGEYHAHFGESPSTTIRRTRGQA